MKKCLIVAVVVAIALTIAGCTKGSETDNKVKIGFLVKSKTEPWFQTEWKFADEAAAKYGFDLIKLEVADGTAVNKQLDVLGAQGAQGVIICTPNQKLGPAIVKKAGEYNMKLMSVDDRLVDADGNSLTDVHHLGISAHEIGKMVGQTLVDEMQKRGWKMEEVGALALTIDSLETAKQRTDGAIEVLTANGFPKANIYTTPWKAGYDIGTALADSRVTLTQHPNVKYWIAFASNDDGVLGAVRATEEKQIPASNVIGVGINGTSGVDDFKKASPTGFFASILLSPKKHGYGTAEAMYKWIKDGVEPPKETWTSGILITRENYKEEMKKEGLD
ncbi:MAG: arabinose ABC transporter substrate-binding protein [Fimbriimonadaceae bacterium]|nr:arabinose ABC transporter substrate-binding protein [Fimbriimonadaceae bacterium]